MKKVSIRYRLMLVMILLAIIPVVTVTTIAAYNTRHSVEKEIVSANTSRMLWGDQYLNELIEQIDVLFYTLQINQKLMDNVIDMDNPNVAIQFSNQNYIQSTLTSAFYSNSRKVDALTMYIHSNSKAYSVDYSSSGSISKLDIRTGIWSRIFKTPINMYFKQGDNGIYAIHSINRFEDHALLGGISVRINRDIWREVSTILKSEQDSSIFLINDEGELLSGSTKGSLSSELKKTLSQLDPKTSKLQTVKTDRHYLFSKRIGDGQLRIVKMIPMSTVNRSMNATIMAGILIGAVFAVISVIIAVLLSFRISKPIIGLAKTMKKAQLGDFNAAAVSGGVFNNDEIEMLEKGYSSMMQRIKQLVENEYQKNLELKNAQLMALQAQINPHFLNNTLQLIGGMALKKKAPEIYQVTCAIGDLLRYSISSDAEGGLVTLGDELKHMQNYILIQQQRFSGRCSIHLDIAEALGDYRMPKFILQPIVENAFEHGLQGKQGTWKVSIRIKQVGSRIAILVCDNGLGIEKEKLIEIRKDLRSGYFEAIETSKRRRGGIGLRNVNSRLRIQFGEHAGTRIFSTAGNGTLVVLMIPMLNKGV